MTIDMHAHWLPEELARAMEADGLTPREFHKLEDRLAEMDAAGYLMTGGEPTGGSFQSQACCRDHAAPPETSGSAAACVHTPALRLSFSR